MNEEKQKVINIFDKKVELKNEKNRLKQDKIKILIHEIAKEGTKNEHQN